MNNKRKFLAAILTILLSSSLSFSGPVPQKEKQGILTTYIQKAKSGYSKMKKYFHSSGSPLKHVTAGTALSCLAKAASDIKSMSNNGSVKNDTNRLVQAGEQLRVPPNLKVLFSSKHCDRVFKKRTYLSCYSYRNKLSNMVFYKITAEQVKGNRKTGHRRFYDEKTLKRGVKAYDYDYVRSGYDRGHVRPHASTDFSNSALMKTYNLINVYPQTPSLNRKIWIKAEKYERVLASRLGSIKSLNLLYFDNNKNGRKYIGKNRIPVPDGFFKVIYSEKEGDQKCFYFANKNYTESEIKRDRLKAHVVPCNKIRIPPK